MAQGKVFVGSEFAPLQKVVLAQSELVFPSKPSDDDRAAVILTQERKDMYAAALERSFAEAFPQKQIDWNGERNFLASVLEAHGVTIAWPRLLTDREKALAGEKGCANFFARHPLFVIGNIIIEGSLCFYHPQ
jgi:hypothetical protein